MIKFFKLGKELLHNSRKSLEVQKENFALSQLNNLFDKSAFLPITIWSIAPSTLLHVVNDIVINKKKQIVEFGGGLSTVYIAKLIKSLELDIKFYSVESNQNWIQKLEKQLKKYEVENFVKIVYAPIVEIQSELTYKTQNTWYDISILEEQLKEINSIDLVLVDGPSGVSTSYARYSAIPFLESKFGERLSVYLDDTDRIEEKEMFSQWGKIIGADVKTERNYSFLHKEVLFNAKPLY